jgi:hypothetical protein
MSPIQMYPEISVLYFKLGMTFVTLTLYWQVPYPTGHNPYGSNECKINWNWNLKKNIADRQEINEEWVYIKPTIIESAKETIKLQEKSPKNERWDEECSQAIKQYKIVKMKCL